MKSDIPSSEITPESTYLNRRTFLRAGVVAASVLATGAIYRRLNGISSGTPQQRKLASVVAPPSTNPSAGFHTDEPLTPLEKIAHYNNFYEFSTDKEEVAKVAEGFVSRPWSVAVEGLCAKPKMFDLDELMNIAPIEERVYRMRCVEAWSMVIPWAGFPLGKLLERVEPRSDAKYVAFETLFDPTRMPGQKGRVLNWPYVEGLRMDEAMHPLAILATGLYGHELPPQDGAPIRLVTPWKYGFKGIKSIVKIRLVEQQPVNSWQRIAPQEYGFYANVNPKVDHPRWSQSKEVRLPGFLRNRPTELFNGYGDQVASLYANIDLKRNF